MWDHLESIRLSILLDLKKNFSGGPMGPKLCPFWWQESWGHVFCLLGVVEFWLMSIGWAGGVDLGPPPLKQQRYICHQMFGELFLLVGDVGDLGKILQEQVRES